MNALIVTSGTPFTRSGTDITADLLRNAWVAAGRRAEILPLPFNPVPPSGILEQVLAHRLFEIGTFGLTVDRLIALNFPAYFIPHPNKVVWLLNHYRPAYDLWNHPEPGNLIDYPDGPATRQAIHNADRQFLREAKAVYTASRRMSERLARFNGIVAEPLYCPPSGAELFRCGEAGGYFFRPAGAGCPASDALLMRAAARCQEPVRICLAGSPSAEALTLAGELGVGGRVEWTGEMTEECVRRWYSHSLAVVIPSFAGDYVPLEAMLSSKPVIGCPDAGGPPELVVDGVTGLIAAADPEAIAARMDALWTNRARAASLGEEARRQYNALEISWERVVEKLSC